jgi:hypothetical protein
MPPFSALNDQNPASACAKILKNRNQYLACHICVPDSEQCLAAIFLEKAYYSFFKFEKDAHRAMQVAAKLIRRGDVSVITEIPKGFAIWVLEKEAELAQSVQATRSLIEPIKPLCDILTSRSQYRPCHIRVPDLEKPLAAIAFNGNFYSLFRVVEEVQQAKQVIVRLSHRKDSTVVTKSMRGYGIWVLEPEGYIE